MSGNMQPLVSVIVCFYNEEEYLSRCLQSIIQQSYKNLQVILIDDGSTDRSLATVGSYKGSFRNIVIKTTDNQGLASARNEGLKHAQGDYLTFLDADDELLPHMIEKCVAVITRYQSDLVIGQFTLVNSHNQLFNKESGIKRTTFGNKSAEALIKDIYSFNAASTVWAKLYRTGIARQLSFPSGLWFEDRPYLLQYVLHSTQATLIPDILLRINNRHNSITRRIMEERRMSDLQKIFELEMDTVGTGAHSTQFRYVVLKHHLHTMLDNLLLIFIEKEEIASLKEVRSLFIQCVRQTQTTVSANHITLSFKDKFFFQILLLPKSIGWELSQKLLQLIFRSRIARLSDRKR